MFSSILPSPTFFLVSTFTILITLPHSHWNLEKELSKGEEKGEKEKDKEEKAQVKIK